MSTHQDETANNLFRRLAAPIPENQVYWRPGKGTQKIPYITARIAMNRLDEVLGPANWWDAYFPIEKGAVCSLSVRLPDGTVVTKCDAGGYAGMQDQGDDEKSAFSDAFKRAAVKFGIARELYGDGVAHLDGAVEPSPAQARPAATPAPRASSQGSRVTSDQLNTLDAYVGDRMGKFWDWLGRAFADKNEDIPAVDLQHHRIYSKVANDAVAQGLVPEMADGSSPAQWQRDTVAKLLSTKKAWTEAAIRVWFVTEHNALVQKHGLRPMAALANQPEPARSGA